MTQELPDSQRYSLRRVVEAATQLIGAIRTHDFAKELAELHLAVLDNEDHSTVYHQLVDDAADDLVATLDVDGEDLNEQMHSAMHEMQNDHPWLLDDELSALVLRYSNHPCAEIFHHGSLIKDDEHGKADFPFTTAAAGAMLEDVKDALARRYQFNGPLTKKLVRDAQKKLKKFRKN